MRVAQVTVPTDDTRRRLEQQVNDRATAARVVTRCRIVLLAAEGLQNKQIAERLKVAPRTAALWRRRFLEQGLEGLLSDAPRPGRKPSITPEVAAALLAKTTQTVPAKSAQWSTRAMAREMGISKASVSRIWRANGLQARSAGSLRKASQTML